MGDVPSSFPSSGLPAGRLFGDDHLHLEGLRERSTPATDGVDKHGGITKVESPTTSFSNGSSKIDATPNVPDQDFGEDGQTEYRHAGKEAKQSKVEKESKFESLARDLLLELKGDEGLRGHDGGEARYADRGDPRLLQEGAQSTVYG